MAKFSILITTKNRLKELQYTLSNISYLLDRADVECIICDDGSTDDTYQIISQNYPNIILIRNVVSKGLIYSRNVLLSRTKADYAISLDDDLNFLTKNPLEIIETIFVKYPRCAVISFRIFWNKNLPKNIETNLELEEVNSFAGGANVIRLAAWKEIPEYPSWFIFHGEEKYAAFQLFRMDWKIYFLPEILAHHRVNLKDRKHQSDYIIRLRRSLRSGWYLYMLFYPIKIIPKKYVYSLWKQFQLRVFKGDLKALIAIIQALVDVLLNLPKLVANRKAFSLQEFEDFTKLPEVKLYWDPNDEN